MIDAGRGLDWLFRNVADAAGRLGFPPAGAALSKLRRRIAAQVYASLSDDVADAHARIRSGDPTGRDALGVLGDRAMADMRDRVSREARDVGLLARASAAFDDRWGGTDAKEYLDDPELDTGLRTRIMENLDAVNDVLESYHAFLDHMTPLMRPDGITRILDLAAGHGGFALAAARDAAERGLAVKITASDIKREYLDIGEGRARAEGLPVRFVVQDALDLSNLEPDEYDIIVCTQSIHHFPAGLVTIMFEEASRAAARGVVFVDGCRSAINGVVLSTFGTLRYLNPWFAHDAWVSCRRFYVPEELGLLARVGAPQIESEARWVPPGHCLLRANTGAF